MSRIQQDCFHEALHLGMNTPICLHGRAWRGFMKFHALCCLLSGWQHHAGLVLRPRLLQWVMTSQHYQTDTNFEPLQLCFLISSKMVQHCGQPLPMVANVMFFKSSLDPHSSANFILRSCLPQTLCVHAAVVCIVNIGKLPAPRKQSLGHSVLNLAISHSQDLP